MCRYLHGSQRTVPLWGGLDGTDQVLEHPLGRPGGGFIDEVGTQALVEVVSLVHAERPSRSVLGHAAILGVKHRTQRRDGVVQPGLRGPDGRAKSVGQPVDGQVGIEVEDEDRPLRHGERPQATLQLVPVGEIGRAIRLARLVAQERDRALPAPAVARGRRAGIDHQPVQPGIEPLDVAQRRQVPPGVQHRFLDGVLGEIGIAQDQAGDRVQSIDAAGGERGEGLSVPTPCPCHQLCLHASQLPRRDLVAASSLYDATRL